MTRRSKHRLAMTSWKNRERVHFLSFENETLPRDPYSETCINIRLLNTACLCRTAITHTFTTSFNQNRGNGSWKWRPSRTQMSLTELPGTWYQMRRSILFFCKFIGLRVWYRCSDSIASGNCERGNFPLTMPTCYSFPRSSLAALASTFRRRLYWTLHRLELLNSCISILLFHHITYCCNLISSYYN